MASLMPGVWPWAKDGMTISSYLPGRELDANVKRRAKRLLSPVIDTANLDLNIMNTS